MLLTTVLREIFTAERFQRVPEPESGMDSEEAVAAFTRAGQPEGILSGVYAFYVENACRMIRPGDRVLDLGCGPGLLLKTLATHNRQATFTGIDCSPRMIESGKVLMQDLPSGNVHLRIDDMTSLSSIASGSVDVVLSSMAMHHLPDTAHLLRAFTAIERVMASGARMFIADFGRLKSIRSVAYFVRRAIPQDEPVLSRDYHASLRAAFSREEFVKALPDQLRGRISIYSTIVSPMMLVLMAPFPETDSGNARSLIGTLPRNRQADYRQLRLCLRLGGMPCR